MGSKRMQGLRFATNMRVWAKSRQHGPTDYHGPNPEPKPGARMRRLHANDRPAPGAFIPALLAATLFGLGCSAPQPECWVFWSWAGLAGLTVLVKRGRRLEFLAVVFCSVFLLFLAGVFFLQVLPAFFS